MKPYWSDEKYGLALYCGDCEDVAKRLPKVDLVVTDPPYPKEYFSCWGKLGGLSAFLLKPGRFMVTLLGHYQLAGVVVELNKHLRYYWCCMTKNARSRIMHGYQMKCCWKPALIYCSLSLAARGSIL
jgi:hypothetical protein